METVNLPAAELEKRINARLIALHLSDRAASLLAGLGGEGIRTIRRGNSPGIDKLLKLAVALETSVAYLTGEIDDPDWAPGTNPSGLSEPPAPYQYEPAAGPIIEYGNDEFTAITRFDARISAGDGAILDPNAEPLGYQLFETQWLKAITRAKPEKLAILRVDGDSMAPTLSDGDWIMIDRSQDRLGREGIYALAINDVAWVKRVSLNLKEKLIRIISDNPLYPVQELEEQEIAVIGRAVAVVARKL